MTYPHQIQRDSRRSTESSIFVSFRVSNDLHVFPRKCLTLTALWCLYFLTSAIRSNVGLALTMNAADHDTLVEYLGLTSHDTSLGLALYYVGYVVFDVPFNLIMTRIAPHAWISRVVTTIGIVGACMAAMKAAWSFIFLRLLLGTMTAGLWPGMAYYLTLWYPPHRCAQRIGFYFTAAQISAAVVGLVSAGFQYMNMVRDLTGFAWMFLIYGLVTIVVGISLLWWLPDRPKLKPDARVGWRRLIPEQRPVLDEQDSKLHFVDMKATYVAHAWTLKDLVKVLLDVRLYPLVLMYFGVVGTGIGLQNFATVIIKSINPKWSSVDLSLLTAPIWICDLIGILIVTPLSDRFHNHRAIFFSGPSLIIIAGLIVTTYAPTHWSRYAGLLITGLGLGPTVPICMTWTAEIFQPRHGEVGTAVATAVVSGLGNLGSITTTYALYSGWAADVKHGYRNSNMVMLAMVGNSILFAAVCTLLRRALGDPMTREQQWAQQHNLQKKGEEEEENTAQQTDNIYF
ncbi:major facilitator superfamily domain-containing protein [Lipomyces tetrasporus]|uniref:Major facilitator superfamily domain-containing protein n=1 Tax=Lipomyces tetrasporus TaxID=54092 RepID=A0AAD7QWR7_9ASCO|nr:major facilitator superfamily domain-containing protein [Lipomyces tetrasporus]KAJ8102616.1 major facilitator superfamily domain-containing protein [Lipomyces tetrasporus]